MKSTLSASKPSLSSSTAILTSLQYYFVPIILLLFVILPEKVNSLQLLAFFYGGLPILDKFFSLDHRNPTEEESQTLQQHNIFYQLCLYVTIIINWMCFYRIINDLVYHSSTLNYLEMLAHLIMYGNIAAMGIVISHEIYHKQGMLKKAIGLLSMINTLYIHWTVEHVIGHHRNVATPKDPATAPKDVSFYEFYPVTVKGTWKSCYEIEKQKGKPFILNLAVLSLVSNFVTSALIYNFYGTYGMIIYLIGGVISLSLLEIVNYIEHYGLLRKKLPNGQYQKVNIRHSWNTAHRFTNYFMFKLQRDSDHHQNSYKPYQILLTLDQSPHLPQGYTAMVVISLFSNVFFDIMNPLLKYYNDKNQGKAVDEAIKIKAEKRAEKFMMKVAFYLIALAVINKIGLNYETIIQGF